MLNKIKELESLINEAEIPVLVYVKLSRCNEISDLEDKLVNILNENNKDHLFYVICYEPGSTPFPEPSWNTIYFFQPKNHRWIGRWNINYLLRNFEDIYNNFEAILNNTPVDVYMAQLNNPEEVEQVREMVEKEDISKYPSSFQMARNLFKEAWKSTKEVVKTGQLLVNADTASKRLDICNSCSYFDKKEERCKKCGCFMSTKVHLKSADCPVNNW